MTISLEALLESRDIIAIDQLVALAGDARACGDDVRAAFVEQAQRRQRAASALLDGNDRADLLASEARAYDRHQREIETILGLARQIEQRTVVYRPPASVADPGGVDRTAEASAVLQRGQSLRDWLRRSGRGGADVGPAPRLGSLVRALATGNRRGLSQAEMRLLAEGTGAEGGYTVPEIVGAEFLDRLRNRAVVFAAGAQTVPMTSDTLHLARVGQPDSVSPSLSGPVWKTENDPITENSVTLERVTFTARTLPMLIRMSIELGEDSANIDAVVEQEMAAAMALELDRAALFGSGSAPEPSGIRYQSGVNVESFGGTEPTNYDFMVDAIGRLWGRNVEPNARIMNAALATRIAKFKSGADDQPLRAPDVVTAVPAFRTEQVPMLNTSPITTSMIVGDFSQLLIGLRTSFRLEVSRVAGDSFDRLQIAVRAYLRADVQLAHPEAFDCTVDIGV